MLVIPFTVLVLSNEKGHLAGYVFAVFGDHCSPLDFLRIILISDFMQRTIT